MLGVVKGYYDGQKIVIDNDDRKRLVSGQELIITYYTNTTQGTSKRLKRLDFLKQMDSVRPSGRSSAEIDEMIGSLRDDRI